MSRIWWLSVLLACSGNNIDDNKDSGGDDGKHGACGAQHDEDFTIRAAAVDAGGTPLADMTITLSDDTTHDDFGGGTTNSKGIAEFSAAGVLVIDDCWGTAVDYHIHGSDPTGGHADAVDDMNTELHNALNDGTMVADVTDFPLEMGAAR